MHELNYLWVGYFWASLKGNGPEALVQTIVYGAIAVAIWPPARRAIERFTKRHAEELHAKLDHNAKLMAHIIKHHPDIPNVDHNGTDLTKEKP